MSDDWNIECSDDEYKDAKGPWEPPPEVIAKWYAILEKGEVPSLNWKCPGYRSPSPEFQEIQHEEIEPKLDDKSDFDFMDEASTPKLKIRNKGQEQALKGSAKKKTTSLDGVINNMRRHNLIPQSGAGGGGGGH